MNIRQALVALVVGVVVLIAISSRNGDANKQGSSNSSPSPFTTWRVTGILLNDESPYLVRGTDGNLYKAQWTGGFLEWKRGCAVTLARDQSPRHPESMYAATNAWQDSDVVISEVIQRTEAKEQAPTAGKHKRSGGEE